MVLAGRLAAGYGDDDPFVIGWREELSSASRRTKPALNAFAITFSDRFSAAETYRGAPRKHL